MIHRLLRLAAGLVLLAGTATAAAPDSGSKAFAAIFGDPVIVRGKDLEIHSSPSCSMVPIIMPLIRTLSLPNPSE